MKNITSRENGKKGGRPISSKTLIAQKIKERIAEKLYAKIDPLIDAQIESAIGVTLLKKDSKGLAYYLQEAPSTPAAKMLLDHVIGKAQESVTHTGEIKGLVSLITELNNDNLEE